MTSPAGYDIQTLKGREKGKDFVYDYKQELSIKNSDNSYTSLKIDAVLSPFFQPEEIHISQAQTLSKDGKGAEHKVDILVKFGNKTVEITRIIDGSRKVESHPFDDACVFATEALMRMIDPSNATDFALPEFNAANGQMEYAVFRRVAGSKFFSLRAARKGQTAEDYYNYDDKGILFESGKANPPYCEKNGTKEFIEALKPIIDK